MARSPFSDTRFRIIFSTVWLVIMADHIFMLRLMGLSWRLSIVDALVNVDLMMLASLLIINMLRYYLPRRERIINLLMLALILTGSVLLLTRWLLGIIFSADTDYMEFLRQSLFIRGSVDFLLISCVLLITVIWYSWQEQKETDARMQDKEKLARDAELYKIRHQLQPHFLFNSLNSINALIGSRPEEARKMIHQLSDFLRGTIKKEEYQWVSLAEELQYLQLYLDIEKVRFGNRLTTKTEIEEGTDSMMLPSLLLQPVMENAIKFGLYDTIGMIEISLSAQKADNNLLVKIVNPFDPETSYPNTGTGFGLQSVNRRLYLLFGRSDLLTVDVKENIFTTMVKIPQVNNKKATG